MDAPDESMKESRKRSAVKTNMLLDFDLGGKQMELLPTEGSEQVEVTDSFSGAVSAEPVSIASSSGRRPRESHPDDLERVERPARGFMIRKIQWTSLW